jgi:hypothetical protein
MSPAGLESENNCAGEDQQQLSEGMLHKDYNRKCPGWKIELLVVILKGIVAKTNLLEVNRQSYSNTDFGSYSEWEWSDSSSVKEEGFDWKFIVS